MKKISLLLILVFVSSSAFSSQAWFQTRIERTMVTGDDLFGGCLFRPAADISTTLDCPRNWVSLDCASALGGSRAEGLRKYQEVQLAMLTGNPVSLRIDDAKTVNGWCVADRIQTTAPR